MLALAASLLLFDVLTLCSLLLAALPVQASTSDSWTKAATAFNSSESGSAEVSARVLPGWVCSRPHGCLCWAVSVLRPKPSLSLSS